MNKKNFIVPLLVFAFGLSSCNSSSHINRKTFSEVSFDNAQKVWSKMKENQESKKLEKGNATMKYSIKLNGKCRVDDVSFHNINFNASAGFSVSWSIKDKYLKIEGENELYYYKWGNYDNTIDQWWKFEEYDHVDGHAKHKFFTDELEQYDDFEDFVYTTIDDYSCINMPGLIELGIGYNGDNSFVSTLTAPLSLVPDSLFEKENYESFEKLKKEYQDENKGYSVDLRYGSNDENTASFALKGKVKSKDFHSGSKYSLGYWNVDLFASFKDNYISQGEYIISGNLGNNRLNNFNLDTNIYLSEEIDQDNFKMDNINPEDWTTQKE